MLDTCPARESKCIIMQDTASQRSRTPPADESAAVQHFRALVAAVVNQIVGRRLDPSLEQWLNAQQGPATPGYERIREACLQGVAEGWMCARERGGIRYGRVLRPSQELHQFSVDVVDMENIVAPHHVHPQGEINMVMPLSADARFDGRAAGWCVYPPKSSHSPAVSGGRALVLYLLPDGKIEFTGA